MNSDQVGKEGVFGTGVHDTRKTAEQVAEICVEEVKKVKRKCKRFILS